LFTLFGPDALAPRLDDSGARLLLVGADVDPARYARPGLEVLALDAAFETRLAGESDRYTPATAADDLALLQYTSGTTRALPEAVRRALWSRPHPGRPLLLPVVAGVGPRHVARHHQPAGARPGRRRLLRPVRCGASA